MPRPLAHLIGTFFGLGHIPVIPATWTSLAVAILFYVLRLDDLGVQALVVVASFGLGVPASTALERQYGKDPRQATVDEVCGMAISLVAVPLTALNVGVAFVLFRGFDVFKPFPGRRMESLPGGWGIMLDDVVAGIYTRFAMMGFLWAVGQT